MISGGVNGGVNGGLKVESGKLKVESSSSEELKVESGEENCLEENCSEVIFDKNSTEKKEEENPKNPTLFFKTQKSHNENENENENENVSLFLKREKRLLREEREKSLSDTSDSKADRIEDDIGAYKRTDGQKEREKSLSEDDERILENYVRRKKLATKNVTAYVRKIIANGDHTKILERERKRLNENPPNAPPAPPKMTREERIKSELESIHDKRSAARILAVYHNACEEFPDELYDVAKKYDLETSDKLASYAHEMELAG